MSDDFDDNDTSTDDGSRQEFASRKQAQAAAQAEKQENEALRRENAMLRAGIPTGTKMGEFFVKHYDGPLDADAITAAAVELGVLGNPEKADSAANAADAEDQAIAQARKGLTGAAASQPDTGPGPDPGVAALDKFREMRGQGLRREDAASVVIDGLIAAGVKGDKRVIHDGWSEEQLAARK